MSKPVLVLQGPVSSRSGYGDHARDILKSLFEIDRYDIKVIPTQWGTTPQNQLNPSTEFGRRTIQSIVTSIDTKPDIYVQISVANEFRPIGKYNIGITAGVETTVAPKEFLDGSNLMDLIIVPSEFTRKTLVSTVYSKIDKNTKKEVGKIKLGKPVDVLFEGVNTDVFTGKSKDKRVLNGIETDFNFLFVGHWLDGKIGEDRKDVGMMIKTFCTTFKSLPKDKQPGLILKTSSAGFSISDRETIVKKIEGITHEYGDECPPIYLLFGDLTETEMNDLYNHPKVKSMVMFTKGEGYGRPLAEFATSGKPIITSNWSGHTDFLKPEYSTLVSGKLTNVDETASNKFLLKESKWFTIDYSKAAQSLYYTYSHYEKELERAKGARKNIINNFTLSEMTKKLDGILTSRVFIPEFVEMELPELNK